MTPQKYISAVLRIKVRQAEYDDLNTSIADVQGHDFYAHLKPIDNYLLETVLDCLDDALFSITDIKELASYYVYESIDAYKIKTHEKEYIWKTGEEFENCIFQMIIDKNSKYTRADTADLKAVRDAVTEAAKTFRWYEELHRAKPDHEKADRNKEFAERMELALARLTEIIGD